MQNHVTRDTSLGRLDPIVNVHLDDDLEVLQQDCDDEKVGVNVLVMMER